MIARKDNKIVFLFLILSLITALAFIATGATISYLNDSKTTGGEGEVGSVKIVVLNNGLNISEQGSPKLSFNVTGTGAVSLNLQVKNTGTIKGLVKINLSFYYEKQVQDGVIQVLLNSKEMIAACDGWVVEYMLSEIENETTGYTLSFNAYLNEVLDANAEKTIVSSLNVVDSNFIGKTIHVNVTAEIIAYSNNAYQLDSTIKPFGSVPNEWTAWRA